MTCCYKFIWKSKAFSEIKQFVMGLADLAKYLQEKDQDLMYFVNNVSWFKKVGKISNFSEAFLTYNIPIKFIFKHFFNKSSKTCRL